MQTKNNSIVKAIPTKEELEGLKKIRRFGIDDLERYKKKLKDNIGIFQTAIDKERTEMKRVEYMIGVLKKDIKNANKLKKLAND